MVNATQIAGELQRGNGRSYAALEPLFAKIMADRIKKLASGHREEAARLAAAARNLFPTQQFGLPDD